MSIQNVSSKIQREHIEKLAFIYVRQSCAQGVKTNVVGGRRQREEVERLASELGWPKSNIVIVDDDQARSGSSTAGRDGYLTILNAIIEGRVGAVFSLESSRVGRDTADWHYLIKMCALMGTLVIDPDGVYDASDTNDNTLMKFKALFGETELAWIRKRMLEARRTLARQGKLRVNVPAGLIYDPEGMLVLDPDPLVQDAIRLVFSVFERFGSAGQVVKHFADQNLRIPSRIHKGPQRGDHNWVPLQIARALAILRNPFYAGTYVYGRSKSKKRATLTEARTIQVATSTTRVAQNDWQVTIHDAFPAYITWAQFLANQNRLQQNQNDFARRTRGATRSGSALLQGLVFCGKCGRKMTVAYFNRQRRPYYVCQAEKQRYHGKNCQTSPAIPIDDDVQGLFLQAVEPAQLKLSLDAFANLEEQLRYEGRQWDSRLSHAQKNIANAQERLLHIDFHNKYAFACAQNDLKEKEETLAELRQEQRGTQKKKLKDLSPKERKSMERLSRDLPLVWQSPTTDIVTKKNLIRCLISDVTLKRDGVATQVSIRWRTLACTTRIVQLPKNGDSTRTPPQVLELVRQLSVDHTYSEIAKKIKDAGFRRIRGGALFHAHTVYALCLRYLNNVGRFSASSGRVRRSS